MRTAVLGAVLILLGAVAIATDVLPVADAVELFQRVWPILLFVVAMTVVTELAAEAGVFDLLAGWAASRAGGRAWVLWMLVLALAVLSTVFLSLDTTAVLLTPIVVVVARQAGLAVLPFAMTTIWIANTGSLLLPVSNLTNLLAVHGLAGMGPGEFAALMAVPSAIAVVVPALVAALVFRKSLRVSFDPSPPRRAEDRRLLVVAVVVLAVLVPFLVSGMPVWIPACAAAVVLLIAFAFRRRSVLGFGLLPWQLVLLASGLFLVVEAAHSLGSGAIAQGVAGSGHGILDLLRLSGSAALSANLIDNLPAYLALEPVAQDPLRTGALLVGVNAGALVTPWASLATLLWHRRLSSTGVEISWLRYAALGAIAAPLTVLAATVGLWLAYRS